MSTINPIDPGDSILHADGSTPNDHSEVDNPGQQGSTAAPLSSHGRLGLSSYQTATVPSDPADTQEAA